MLCAVSTRYSMSCWVVVIALHQCLFLDAVVLWWFETGAYVTLGMDADGGDGMNLISTLESYPEQGWRLKGASKFKAPEPVSERLHVRGWGSWRPEWWLPWLTCWRTDGTLILENWKAPGSWRAKPGSW